MSRKSFILIYVIILFMFIVGCVLVYNNHMTPSYTIEDHDRGLDLYSFYDENSINFEVKTKEEKDIVYSYIQINGLKKSKTENNINKELINQMNSGVKDDVEKVNMIVNGNFGNILSITINYQNKEGIIKSKYVNYNLVTGEKISLDDLFTTSASITDIVERTIRNQILDEQKLTCQYDEKGNLIDKKSNCVSINEIIIKYLDMFRSNEYQFFFTNIDVNLEIGDRYFNIFYFDNADYFNLYTKYLTNISIYKDDKIGKKDMLIASYRDSGIYSILEEKEENLYIDSVIITDDTNIPENVKNTAKSLIDSRINNVENDEKYVFLNQESELTKQNDCYYNEEEILVEHNRFEIYDFTIKSHIYETSKDYFNNSIKEQIFLSHRTLKKHPNNFVNIDKNKQVHLNVETEKKIILANGQLLETIDDLFIEGCDYKKLINEKLLDILEVQEIDKEKLQYNYQLYTGEFDSSYCIVVKGLTTAPIYIPFAEFEQGLMNIY